MNTIPTKAEPPLPRDAGRSRAARVNSRRPRAAFTLIEIMVVVIILGILAATIIPQFIGTTHDARVSAAKANIAELEAALERFYVQMDRYPTTEEGLKVLVEAPSGEAKKWRGPYIKLLRPDPWGNPYQYLRIDGGGAQGKSDFRKDKFLNPINTDYDLYSMGKDGLSQKPLNVTVSQDDIIRAHDGGFVGLASDFSESLIK